jgi:hypothetical protein
MSCSTCGCSPCQCGGSGTPAVLANTQLLNPAIVGALIDGGTLNSPAINSPTIVGGTIDCTARGCTAGNGVCNDGLATNAKVCNEIALAISGSNPAFCQAIEDCLAGDPSILCPTVASCINTTPGIINNTQAFGFNARATTALYGVTRFATGIEALNGSCLLALDPCTLVAALASPTIGSTFFNAFVTAVNAALGGASLCDAVDACGFARLDSPTFIGVPRAPTAAPGTSSTQIATTAFVGTAVSNAISASNPAFCAAVSACGGGGGGGGGSGGGGSCTPEVIARGRFQLDTSALPINAEAGPLGFTVNCSISYNNPTNGWVTITLANAAANLQYDIIANGYFVSQTPFAPNPTTLVFTLQPQAGVGPSGSGVAQVDFVVVESRTCAAGAQSGFAAVAYDYTLNELSGNFLLAVTPLYGCSAALSGAITFTAPQPDTNFVTSTSFAFLSGPAVGFVYDTAVSAGTGSVTDGFQGAGLSVNGFTSSSVIRALFSNPGVAGTMRCTVVFHR